ATNSKVVAKVVENEIHVNITGSDAGLLIGKHGETLDAISYYTNLYLNRKTNSRIRLILDIEDYRLNRKIALEALAKKMANSVVTNNRNVTLEPMQPYERRIIHTALEGFEGITTYSVGNDPYRKIVIAVKKNK
ncbi:MAG: RNA-binding cell elongation regulator Jag/EloR, partial [Clostridia bacterium]